MLTKEQKKQAKAFKKEQREIKRAKEIAHCRGFKNFGWWIFGFISSFIIVGTTAAVCVCVLPMSTYVGKDGKYVDKETSNNTLLQFLMNYKSYSVSNFPVIKEALQKLVVGAGLDKYVEVDYDKLAETLTFDVSNISFNDIYNNCIDVICTIDSLDMSGLLGDFANLSIMNESTPVSGEIDTSSESFRPYMYYYLNENNVLKRAYDDEGKLLPEAEGKQLYYPALRKIPLDDLIKVLPNRIGQEEVLNVVKMVTTVEKGSIFEKIFDGYTIEELGSFDVNSILLSNIIDITDDNRSMFNIICSAVKLEEGQSKPTPETLTVANLSNIDINSAHLVDIVEPNENNKDLYALLRDSSGKATNEEITINDVINAKVDDVKLSSLLPYEENEKLADVLASACEMSYGEITFKNLKNIDTDKIKLSVVVSSLDDNLKQILSKGCGVSSFDELKIGDLSSFNMNSVLLSDAMPSLSDNLKDILVKGCDATSYEELTFDDLNNFNINKLPLSMVLENNSTNEKLISILLEASGNTNYDDMTVADLSSADFNIDNVRLITVLGENDTLFDILKDATGKSKDEVRISDLSSFSLDNVKLSTVLKENTGNKILDALLKDDEVTLSNIGTKINNMAIYDFYGEECFTLDSSKSAFPDDHYAKSVNSEGLVTFSIDTDGDYTGDYYISKECGFFGMLCFTVEDTNTSNGRGNTYVQSSYTYSDLESNSEVNNIIENSTIYQLVAVGAIENKSEGGYSDKLLKRTIKEILDIVDALPSY